ncbi:MAG TPA: glycosyl hydrolase [Firmicutes bacterium]|nr:glycosyl hydrolase [Bacillota bacterium]
MKINRLRDSLTLDEKIALVSGAAKWHLRAIPRLGLAAVMVADGPHGLIRQKDGEDHLGLSAGEPATCFPTAAALANSWDPKLVFAVAAAIGEEALQEGVSVVLGPGANIKRSPLCGRNFEYFSEDPYVSGQLAAAWVEGIQSRGVGASLKHFAGNNQERWRMTNNSLIDERALREIYLAGFEYAVKKAKPWTVMAAYNKLNGVHCTENERLLKTILREEWGFQGLVLSDWGAVNDPVAGIKAGLDLEMPASFGRSAFKIRQDLKTGRLTEAALNKPVQRVLRLIGKAAENKSPLQYDAAKHHLLAKRAAAESAVLLKNDDNLLPLDKKDKIAVVGEFAKNPRIQGMGSSLVNPTGVDTVCGKLKEMGLEFDYAPGYSLAAEENSEELISAACETAAEADVTIIFAGLPAGYESEGYDRQHLNLPPSHVKLIEAVKEVCARVVVVLTAGAPVVMPWLEKVTALLHTYLPGQAGAGAIVDLLFGRLNPGGKLAETYPLRLEDVPAHLTFAVDRYNTEYWESIYVGYRYYDTAWAGVLFPFGYGLSYTTFAYDDLEFSEDEFTPGEPFYVSCTVENTGEVAGAEIVQLYISKTDSALFRPEHELKGFRKVFLAPGEKKRVQFSLDERSFAYYNARISAWHVEEGEYEIRLGASSRDIRLVKTVFAASSQPEVEIPCYKKKAPSYYNINEGGFMPSREDFLALWDKPLPWQEPPAVFNENSTLEDLKETTFGSWIIRMSRAQLRKMLGVEEENDPLWLMAWASLLETPFRSIGALSGGQIAENVVASLVALANGKYFRALKHWLDR